MGNSCYHHTHSFTDFMNDVLRNIPEQFMKDHNTCEEIVIYTLSIIYNERQSSSITEGLKIKPYILYKYIPEKYKYIIERYEYL